jgi:hypothetical protein
MYLAQSGQVTSSFFFVESGVCFMTGIGVRHRLGLKAVSDINFDKMVSQDSIDALGRVRLLPMLAILALRIL